MTRARLVPMDPIERVEAVGVDPHEDPQVERERINFSWILKLRWAAAAGQLATVLVVEWGMHISIPVVPMIAIIAFELVSNAALEWWFRNQLRHGSWEQSYHRSEVLLGCVMIGDVVLLTALLYLSAGPSNPFSIFYLVNIVLAAVVLPSAWAWAVNLVALTGFSWLFFFHLPLPGLEAWRLAGTDEASMNGVGDLEQSTRLYFQGILAALCAAGVFMAYFVTRLTGELGKREHELLEVRLRRAQSERLEALATLAAGAAHELASPLSTIAVVAKELEIELGKHNLEEVIVDDAHLIRDEVARCRAILDQMSVDAGQSRVESMGSVTFAEILESAMEGLQRREAIETEVGLELDDCKLYVSRRTFALALRGLIKNALDASPALAVVGLRAGLRGEELCISVRDRGTGMRPEVLQRATDPFFTTKEPGQGMGLGLFLARTVVERLGGVLAFDSTKGRGTTAHIRIPLSKLGKDRAEGD